MPYLPSLLMHLVVGWPRIACRMFKRMSMCFGMSGMGMMGNMVGAGVKGMIGRMNTKVASAGQQKSSCLTCKRTRSSRFRLPSFHHPAAKARYRLRPPVPTATPCLTPGSIRGWGMTAGFGAYAQEHGCDGEDRP